MDENNGKKEDKEKETDPLCQHSVKSRAIVKYSTVNTPAHFAQLEYNTDLNLPPSNWLFSSTKNYGLHHPVDKSNEFTSLRLAHMYSDCIGEVDVVSDAENIKKLLKIPYNKAPISMMIHRIENTLLIDEFDIHKHLLLQAENDWQWLRKFFFENVIKSLPRNNFVLGHRYTRSILQQKSLVSKFLHYSFGEQENKNGDAGKSENGVNSIPDCTPKLLIPTCGPVLPEPEPGEGLPDSGSEYKFIRNVVWSFEDIQMLLGTDMPIFGGTTHPCISLRLRDIEKPISVLTGIDYWLDNLMSNVPEVVMCYHLDGIVQKYELIKTEDLPHLTDPKFSPELIRDVAQNILSFLKSNATKAGHTYWLFKGRDDDVVKLYDLSSICSESLADKEQNPFTVPVGLLFYRVARNMKQSRDHPQPSTVRMLLKNCLALLPKEKYPQIVTSAHYMLSDIYIPVDMDPCSPQVLEETMPEHDQTDDDPEDNITRTQVPVKSLCIANYISDRETKYHPPPIVGSINERCMTSLFHISQGLDCLQYFTNINNKKTEPKEEIKMAKSSEPIPMPYSKLPDNCNNQDSCSANFDSMPSNRQSSGNELLIKTTGEPVPTWQRSDKMDNMSWKIHLEDLLVKKACLVYLTLIEQYFSAARYGSSLKYINTYIELCKVGPMEIFNLNQISRALKKAGDCCFHIAKSWHNVNVYKAEINDPVLSLSSFFHNNHKDAFHNSDLLDVPTEVTSIGGMFLASKSCYSRALKLLDQEDQEMLTRLGNIQNEIGILHINQAYECYQTSQSSDNISEVTVDEMEQALKKAEMELKEGFAIFDKLSDAKNCALLLSNQGKLFRLRAFQHPNSPQLIKHFHQKAEENYLGALKAIGCRKEQPEIWDTVFWELSSFLFQQAFSLHESHLQSKSLEEMSREVIELCQKCLKYCDLTTMERRLLLYQFRAARLHHILASIFHKQYRTFAVEDGRRKMVLKLCQNHLLKATSLFQAADSYSDILSVYLERISLLEFQASEVSSGSTKIKLYKSAISLLCELRPVLEELHQTCTIPTISTHSHQDDDGGSINEEGDKNEEIKLMTLEKIICSILKDVMLISLKSKCGTRNLMMYKEAYGHLLKKNSNSDLINVLLTVIDLMSNK